MAPLPKLPLGALPRERSIALARVLLREGSNRAELKKAPLLSDGLPPASCRRRRRRSTGLHSVPKRPQDLPLGFCLQGETALPGVTHLREPDRRTWDSTVTPRENKDSFPLPLPALDPPSQPSVASQRETVVHCLLPQPCTGSDASSQRTTRVFEDECFTAANNGLAACDGKSIDAGASKASEESDSVEEAFRDESHQADAAAGCETSPVHGHDALRSLERSSVSDHGCSLLAVSSLPFRILSQVVPDFEPSVARCDRAICEPGSDSLCPPVAAEESCSEGENPSSQSQPKVLGEDSVRSSEESSCMPRAGLHQASPDESPGAAVATPQVVTPQAPQQPKRPGSKDLRGFTVRRYSKSSEGALSDTSSNSRSIVAASGLPVSTQHTPTCEQPAPKPPCEQTVPSAASRHSEDPDEDEIGDFMQDLFEEYAQPLNGGHLMNCPDLNIFFRDFIGDSRFAHCEARLRLLYEEELQLQQDMRFRFDLSLKASSLGLCYKSFLKLLDTAFPHGMARCIAREKFSSYAGRARRGRSRSGNVMDIC
eukprot:gnl/TRDRNA2_/TRDRNA2_186292_c0_seq1.p1 gnl/TRDRNA2_/TRDRNA2_186292_c0~~gnl/TRDRNA2_/TRDRNA2_186292_c0_seq1.p1  ORF type:complete len:540 (+),score=69.38 gnl/TRDRNA2_/TRDRNA2_186292_c0_seq1:110-1729(+)